ncbi:L-2-amino-thiazoline-4-carboxylic acid hydrolase [Oceanobacillus sojae]|uniref:L-2-amino-thiazoline-4-carboxylic acid hydrolase n=1 Tax=Oceanobacillus sojae TaxID=582851 RepID=UPI0009887760|nr:L-2-amino-thiazoline-4-carboxylic acid hydrolase [Oceanobacillus sojae]MCT1905397.1 L-2-amino-thiazoline-4-carboxylic acid hydrolase [Oceanobacillus sojae]
MSEEKLMMKALSMDIITAKMFTELHLSITEAYGEEEGRKLVKQGLEAFGLKDAETMAKKATAEGQNHSFYEYLPQVVEVEEKYADLTTFARFSKMFAQISKQVVDKYEEEGEDVIRRAVERYGRKRGEGIAQRARSNGLENNSDNYLKNYDMARSELFEVDTVYKENEVEQTFTYCPFGQQWADDDMGKYGILYCQVIDPSVAKGYNKNFEVVHDQYVLREGQCHFQFQMKK